jgi:hypothetical protein
MLAVRDDAQFYWEQYAPGQFINQILRRTLEQKISSAYVVIHTSVQLVDRAPNTAGLKLRDPIITGGQPITAVRAIFTKMGRCAVLMHDAIHEESLVIVPQSTPHWVILSTVRALRAPAGCIEQLARAVRDDYSINTTLLPGNKSLQAVAMDILQQIAVVTQLLDRAQSYAETLKQRSG